MPIPRRKEEDAGGVGTSTRACTKPSIMAAMTSFFSLLIFELSLTAAVVVASAGRGLLGTSIEAAARPTRAA
jgi:hypothetical protein